MSKFKFCRICLDNNVRMHLISASEIEDVYEKLTKKKIQDDGNLYYACYICYCQLKNSQQLVIKSQKSEELLAQISVNTPELNLKAIPVIDRLLCGLQNSLIVADIVSLQIPEYDKTIKTENQADNVTNETCNTSEPDDDRALANKKPNLNEKYNLSHFKAFSIETKNTKIISGTQTKIVANKSSQSLYDGNNKQVLVKNNYTSVQRDHLKNHISTHKGEKPFKCQYCNYRSSQTGHLKNHMRTHTGEKPFKCQYCSYTSTENSHLTKHIRTHTGEKPFKCQYCSYTCKQSSGLKIHIRTHSREKPFKCEYCSYTCAQRNSFNLHIRTHTGEKPFKCQYCSYTCTKNSSLNEHIRTHTGEKPFKCQYCSYTCARNSSLKLHIRTHTGEKPFKCQYCSYTCISSSNLQLHIRTHTGRNP